jgi:hypothetical protein
VDRPTLEVADVFRQYGAAYRAQTGITSATTPGRVMSAIEQCRTAALGGHVEACDACGRRRVAYNSCRNRHCPKCQSLARAEWLEHRTAELLNVPYFHVVFTLPTAMAAIAYQNKRVVYTILFRAVAQTLRTIAADPQHLGAGIGFFAVLHTWGQTLVHHPHLHCVIPGGGLSPDGMRWVSCRSGFFLPVRVLSRLFRRLFLDQLCAAFDQRRLHFFNSLHALADREAFLECVQAARQIDWVVYAKRPFAGPQQVLEYVGRYTHRVALSNNRLVDATNGQVRFRWKDYRSLDASEKIMALAAFEFIRRFLLHVLPRGFQRIRYFGLLGNRHRRERLMRCRSLLGTPSAPVVSGSPRVDYRDRYHAVTGRSLRVCPFCRHGHLIVIEILERPFARVIVTNTS